MLSRPEAVVVPKEDPFANDLLDRKAVATNLSALVQTMSGPAVIAIDAPWGGGKTTFVKMWKQHLTNASHATIYFNAWDADFSEDPLLAFVATLGDQLPPTVLDKAKAKILALGGSLLRRGIPLLVHGGTTGVLEVGAFSFVEKSADAVGKWAGEVAKERLAALDAEKNAVSEFRDNLSKVASSILDDKDTRGPLVIFVDELDRCRPDFAIQLLERIKHLFDVEGIVFVLSLDQRELAHSICAVYGQKFDAIGYLGRFVDFTYTLPAPDREKFVMALAARTKLDEVMEPLEIKFLGTGVALLADDLALSLRTVEQAFAEISVVLRVSPPGLRRKFGDLVALIIMVRYRDRAFFDQFLDGREGAQTVITRLEELGVERFLHARQGAWAEAQVRLASKVEGEFSQYVADLDERTRETPEDVDGREHLVREATKEIRGGADFTGVGDTIASLLSFSGGLTFPSLPDPGPDEASGAG